MTDTESSFQELPEARCRELLAGHTAGRVAWNAPDGPHVLPVSYAIDVGNVVFRTSRYGALAELRDRTNVAFEIDDIDAEHGTGWSVVVRGHGQAGRRGPPSGAAVVERSNRSVGGRDAESLRRHHSDHRDRPDRSTTLVLV